MNTLEINTFKLSIGGKVKELRIKKGYSVRGFALIADMEHHQVLDIEKGKIDFRLSTLVKLSNALQISPMELMTK